MKGKLLWSYDYSHGNTHWQDLPPTTRKLILFFLVSMFTRFVVPVFNSWILIPLVVILPWFLLGRGKRRAEGRDFYSDDYYVRIHDNGIDLKTSEAHGFYQADDIVLDTLQVQQRGSPGFAADNRYPPTLDFETRSPKMTVRAPLSGITKQKLAELERFIDGLKRANPNASD